MSLRRNSFSSLYINFTLPRKVAADSIYLRVMKMYRTPSEYSEIHVLFTRDFNCINLYPAAAVKLDSR